MDNNHIVYFTLRLLREFPGIYRQYDLAQLAVEYPEKHILDGKLYQFEVCPNHVPHTNQNKGMYSDAVFKEHSSFRRVFH